MSPQDICERIGRIRRRISELSSLNQDKAAGDVLLVSVTNTIPPEIMKKAILEAGITDIGENRIQESITKYHAFRQDEDKKLLSHPLRWHLIGHLQTNKAARAVEIFDLIQSVDSWHLASELNRRAASKGKVQDILIEVKVSPEDTKYGCPPSEVKDLARRVSQELKSLRLAGLMAMAPYFGSSSENPSTLARPYFKKAREVYEDAYDFFAKDNPYTSGRPVLSMGMSSDFEAAISEGANMVRIGSAIFKGE